MSTIDRESQTVSTARVEELLAARTPGYWVAGIDIEPEDDGYWAGDAVYAVDALPVPGFSRGSDTAEVDADLVARWDDEHCRGHVADTHNYFSIPDEQHDANQRLMALAPVLAEEVLRLRGQSASLAAAASAALVVMREVWTAGNAEGRLGELWNFAGRLDAILNPDGPPPLFVPERGGAG